MPYCSWCRRYIEKSQSKWRCDDCGTYFCEHCARESLHEACPFCLKEGRESALKLYTPPTY